MASDKSWKIAVVLGVVLIIGTASFMFMPFASEKGDKNPITPFHATFQNMRSAEDNMMDFIDQEKSEIAAQVGQFSFP